MLPPGGPMGRGYLTEEEKANRPKVTATLLKRVFSYLTPYWPQLLLALGCIAVSSVLNLLPSVLTGRILDDGLIGRDLRMLVLLILLSLGVTLGANLIGVAESYLNNWIAQHITYDMRNSMYRHLQQMSQRFFTASSQGDISRRSGLFLLLSGLATGASWLCYYRALQVGEASRVVPVDKLSVVITLILAFALLGEHFTPKSLVGMALITAGTLAMVL